MAIAARTVGIAMHIGAAFGGDAHRRRRCGHCQRAIAVDDHVANDKQAEKSKVGCRVAIDWRVIGGHEPNPAPSRDARVRVGVGVGTSNMQLAPPHIVAAPLHCRTDSASVEATMESPSPSRFDNFARSRTAGPSRCQLVASP